MPTYTIQANFTVDADSYEEAYDNLDEILSTIPTWRDGVTSVDIVVNPPDEEVEEPVEEPEPEPVTPVVPLTLLDPSTGLPPDPPGV